MIDTPSPPTQDQQVGKGSIYALVPYGAHPAFGVRVGLRRPRRRHHRIDSCGVEDRIEGGGELAVAIPGSGTGTDPPRSQVGLLEVGDVPLLVAFADVAILDP